MQESDGMRRMFLILGKTHSIDISSGDRFLLFAASFDVVYGLVHDYGYSSIVCMGE